MAASPAEVSHMLALESRRECAGNLTNGVLPSTPLCLGSPSSWDPDMAKNKIGCFRARYKDLIRQIQDYGASPPFQSYLHLRLPNSKKWHLINTSEEQALTDNSFGYFYWSYKYPVSFSTLINSWPCQFSDGNESHCFFHCLKMYFLLSVFNLPPFSFIEHLCSCIAETGKTTAPK